jgi:hypothetical protein
MLTTMFVNTLDVHVCTHTHVHGIQMVVVMAVEIAVVMVVTADKCWWQR